MLSCFRPRASDTDDAKFVHSHKPLWACEAPGDAAELLRAIGLNRLANTVLSNGLTGHVLARLIDNIPAKHFVGEPDAYFQKPGQDEAKKSINAIPLPAQQPAGALKVSVYDYKLVENPRPPLAGQTPERREGSMKRIVDAEEQIVDEIPSARQHLEEYSAQESSGLHILDEDRGVEPQAHWPMSNVPSNVVRGAVRAGVDADEPKARGVINLSVKPRNKLHSIAQSDYLAQQENDGAINTNFMQHADTRQTRPFAASASLGVPQSIHAATQSSSRVPPQSQPQPARAQVNWSWEVEPREPLKKSSPDPALSQHASEPSQWQGPSHQKPLQDNRALGAIPRNHETTHYEGRDADSVGGASAMSRSDRAPNISTSPLSAGTLPPLNGTRSAQNSLSLLSEQENDDAGARQLSREEAQFSQGPGRVLIPGREAGAVVMNAKDAAHSETRGDDLRKSPFQIARRRFSDLSLPPNLRPAVISHRKTITASTNAAKFISSVPGSPPPPSTPEHLATRPDSMSSPLLNGFVAGHGQGSLRDAAATYAEATPTHLQDVQAPKRPSLASRTSVLINPLDRAAVKFSADLKSPTTSTVARNTPPVSSCLCMCICPFGIQY